MQSFKGFKANDWEFPAGLRRTVIFYLYFCFWRHWWDAIWTIPGVSMLTLAAILLLLPLDLSQPGDAFAVIYCTGTYGGAITVFF